MPSLTSWERSGAPAGIETRPTYMTPRCLARDTIAHEVIAIMRLLGWEPMPWQREILETAFEVDSFGLLWYQEIVIIVPRQSGKSTIVIPWGLHRMVMWPTRQRMLYIAQTRDKALEKLVEEHFFHIEKSPFRQLLVPNRAGKIQPALSHGSEQLKFVNGSRWAIDAPTESAGHGGTLGLTIGDEIFTQKDNRLEAALMPTKTTIPDAQSMWISTVGESKAKSPFLWGKAEAGRAAVTLALADPSMLSVGRTLYVEFSAPDSADWLDPLTWWLHMPALGYTTTEATIAGFATPDKEAAFRRAFLNQWADDLPTDGKIPLAKWAELEDPESEIPSGGQLTWVVDVSPDRAWSSISVAGKNADGIVHVELVERGPGTDWVVHGNGLPSSDPNFLRGISGLVDRQGGADSIFYDHITAGTLVPEMVEQGLYPKPIAAADVKIAGPALLDAVLNGRLRHIGQFELLDAMKSAVPRVVGDGWAWARGRSMQDITALVSMTFAHWMFIKELPDRGRDVAGWIRQANEMEG